MAETTIAEQITRLTNDRNTIRNKVLDFGLVESTANLDALATAIDGITNCGAVSAQVQEGATYTIPKGYHNGSGTVSGVKGGGNYNLQSKNITPTKSQKNVTPDPGYYGLSDVTVEAIPAAYQDVTSVTAVAGDVLANKIIVTADGTVTTGTMTNNGAVSKKLDTATTSYAVPAGYHNGKGTVSITTETKSATPSKEQQTVTPTEGSVLSSVTVQAIPEEYADTSDATATAAQILTGQTAYVDGEKVTGTMPNNSPAATVLDTETSSYTIPAGYHDGTGSVSLSLETKSATPTKAQQTIEPSDGKVLSAVTVKAIPAQFVDTSTGTAVAGDILTGKIAFVNGASVTGSMPNNGATNLTIDGMQETSVAVSAGYTTGGTVSLTNSIETALAAI